MKLEPPKGALYELADAIQHEMPGFAGDDDGWVAQQTAAKLADLAWQHIAPLVLEEAARVCERHPELHREEDVGAGHCAEVVRGLKP